MAHLQYGWWFAHWGSFNRRERAAIALAGAACDLDGLSLLAGREAFYRYHHVLFHNAGATLALAAMAGLAFWRKPLVWFFIVFSFAMHILEDYFTSAWDLFPWAPFRFSSANLAAHLPAWMVQGVFQAAGTIFILGVTVWIYLRHRRTPLEIFSPDFDRLVIHYAVLPWRNRCHSCPRRARFRCESCLRNICSGHARFTPRFRVRCRECGESPRDLRGEQ